MGIIPEIFKQKLCISCGLCVGLGADSIRSMTLSSATVMYYPQLPAGSTHKSTFGMRPAFVVYVRVMTTYYNAREYNGIIRRTAQILGGRIHSMIDTVGVHTHYLSVWERRTQLRTHLEQLDAEFQVRLTEVGTLIRSAIDATRHE